MDDDTAEPTTDTAEGAAPTEDTPEQGDMFSREYVEGLRRESAGYRDRTKVAEARAEELSRALFAARVAALGKLENPAEISYDPDIVDDADAITAAVDAAIAERPYIRAHKISGDIGGGQRGKPSAPQDFSGLFR